MSSPSGSMRAGNDDREKVVARLNTAFAEGRLDVGELDERVAAAYAAKTLAELEPLTVDLPADHRPAPVPAPRASGEPARRSEVAASDESRWAPVAGTFGLFLVNVLIWGVISLTRGDAVYFWPVWVLIPFVFAVVGVISRGHGGGHGSGHGGHR